MRGLARALGALLIAAVAGPLVAAPAGFTPPAPPIAVSAGVAGQQQSATVGDSMIAGALGNGTTIATTYQSLSGSLTTNAGIGGQTSSQIAWRIGAVIPTLTFAGNTIATFASRTSVTAINGIAPAAATAILSTPADTVNRELTGVVSCSGTPVTGTLTRIGTSEAYWFRPKDLAVAQACPTNSPFTPDFNWNAQPLVADMGRNDFSSPGPVLANAAAFFAKCAAVGNNQCYLLNIPTGPNEGASTSDTGHTSYVNILSLNSQLAAQSPAGHVLAWREWMVSQYNPSIPADVSAFADDQIPPSLQGGDGSVHFNAAGYMSSGNFVFARTKGALLARSGTTLSIDSLNPILNGPLQLAGSTSVGCGRPGQYAFEVCGVIKINSGYGLVGVDNNSNYVSLLNWNALTSTESLGGANLQNLQIGVNGITNAITLVSNVGDLQVARSYQDRSYSTNIPATGATVTIADTSDLAIIDPAGALAALTVKLPTCSATYDGKLARFNTSQAITALTMGATAGTVLGAPTSMSANTAAGWICRGANTTWYRL